MTDAPFDVVVFGATGFTGGLVTRYLARKRQAGQLPDGFRFAIAGRDANKLRRLAESVEVPVGQIVANTTDQASVDSMARQARVVLTTVGPYAQLGEPLVKACLSAGADYLDITGEPTFVNRIRDRYDAEARDAGVLVINCCGFDSIPADLGALFTVLQMPGTSGKSVTAYVKTKGQPSGGTWASIIGAFAEGPGGLSRQQKATRNTRGGRTKRRGFHRVEHDDGWALPMPVIDPVIVKRSSRRHEAYGADFRYQQFLRLGSLAQVGGLLGGVAGVFALSQTAMTRRWLLGRRPSGDGPNEEVRAKSFFELTFVGTSERCRVVTRVSGADPGYDETSKMLAEAGVLVATRKEDLRLQGGVVTPAGTFGELLIDQLRDAGIRFEVIEGPTPV